MTPHQTAANAIRMLTVDAVAQAKSGHQGMPMGMAEIAVELWGKHLRHNPQYPQWVDRDRFVVSNGHGSMLPYALLHLAGYDLPMSEIKNFRQLHSKTPGHPEVGVTLGIETTTGPLGQGLANAVGMALAEAQLAKRFNKPGHIVVDHRTWCLVGDGCLMEGISHEACSLAGVWGLHKLCVIYDDNGISIDGEVKHWFRDDTAARFLAYGWHVIGPIDGHDAAQVDAALSLARKQTEKPTLIIAKTTIGKGSPNKANTSDIHGVAVTGDEIAATRKALGWTHAPFEVPAEAFSPFKANAARGAESSKAHAEAMAQYAKAYPQEAAELSRRLKGELPANFTEVKSQGLAAARANAKDVASRKAAQDALQFFGPALPEMIGGSADLTGSVFTNHKTSSAVSATQAGNHVSYGVREFAMGAVANGLALHGGFLPYVGTFMVFSDYARNAVRMAALMNQRVIFVFTHDSIGVGEDGPTHQPIEHTASLRLIPNLNVWRPADAVESTVAYAAAISRTAGPSVLALSRQNLAVLPHTEATQAGAARGAYVLSDAANPRAVLIATGSEVGLALTAQKALAEKGVAIRVVSMPCTQVFDAQDAAYRSSVLPASLPKVALEMGASDGWWKYIGGKGDVIGIDRFGESAPANVLFKHFGFTVENVVARVLAFV